MAVPVGITTSRNLRLLFLLTTIVFLLQSDRTPTKDSVMTYKENCNECKHFVDDSEAEFSIGPAYCTFYNMAVMGNENICDDEELE